MNVDIYDTNQDSFDFRGNKLTVRELEKEFISLEDRDKLKLQNYEDDKFRKQHGG